MSDLSESKYFNNIEEKVFRAVSIIFIIATIVMPPYFGIPVPGFDLAAIRIMIIVLMLMICLKRSRLYDFLDMIQYNTGILAVMPYIFVNAYTMVFRVDIKAFLNPFIEFLTLFLTIYVVSRSLGMETTLKVVLGCYYLFAYQGIIEYFLGKSLFTYLQTLNASLLSGAFIRSGHYRIVGPAVHALGYGLILNIGVPLSCLDFKNKKLYLFQRPVLFLLLLVNIVFTGSRSSFAVFFVELAGIFLLSEKAEKKRALLVGVTGIVVFGTLLIALSGTSVGSYFMLQITGVIDEIFGTSYSLKYGATLIAQQSSDYRDYLWYVFSVSWLNPLIGIGRTRTFSTVINGVTLESLDNFYIAEYVRYAYPGMFSIILFFGFYLVKMIRSLIVEKNAYTKTFLLCSFAYALSLYFVDSLGTLKYLYLIFALFVCSSPNYFELKAKRKTSIYMKRAI